MKIRIFLKVMSDLEEGFFIKVPAHELQADGQVIFGEPAGDGQGGNPRQVR